MTKYAMPAETVRALIAALSAYEVAVCVGGGWAVDALVGRQTRQHADLDVWADTALLDVAAAVAAALHDVGDLPVGADAVRVRVGSDGGYRAELDGVTTEQSAVFTAALDEVLSPIGDSRYLVRRLILDRRPSTVQALAYAMRRVLGLGVGAAEVWHAVPAGLATNKRRAQPFARRWEEHVSPTRLLYTRSAEGEGVLAAQRGGDPFAMTTALRTVWC